MVEVFDTARQSFDGHVMLLLPGAALLVTILLVVRGARRSRIAMGAGVTLLLLLMTSVLPLADQRHVRAMAASPAAHTVEGRISGHRRETYRRWTGRSRGVGITSSDSYTTVTEEQFWIGRTWFWFRVNGLPSQASFTNGGDPPLPLSDGTWAKATYFDDPWYQDERRIVRLALRGGAGNGDGAVVADEGFAAFWQEFAAAVGRGDERAVRARTRFPFLFAGTPLDGARFATVWQALFTPPPLKQCLAKAVPVPDGKARSVGCGVYVYLFEKGADGWRFAGFTADPEAE